MQKENIDELDELEIEKQELDLADYPLDDILIRTSQLSISQVIEEINDDLYILAPDFQRAFVWSSEQQSRLIESVLMRIPLPVFYFAETKNGETIIVDGLQRITTFHRFMNDEFKLTHVANGNNALHDKRFSELHPKFKTRIKRTNLILYIIDEKAPSRAKLDIFERVNSGTTLTRQQMRNCLYMGAGTRWLRDRADSDYFKKATGYSLNTKTMRDRELINRFCAFRLLGHEKYQGYMDDFLAECLEFMNDMSEEKLKNLASEFEQSMRNTLTLFGKHAFRKHSSPDSSRSVINASLFDIFSVAFARISSLTVKENKKTFRSLFYSSMNDEKFINSITYSTNQRRQVTERFKYIDAIFGEYYD
ncbi:MAG: DUF262 domain-containing protein [Candidatus Electrothrix sp. AR1]|nr:DUF262 domain-containing protein [Candidatus Electrothrix sp. AR1]